MFYDMKYTNIFKLFGLLKIYIMNYVYINPYKREIGHK